MRSPFVTATTPGCTAADVTMLAADNAALHAKMTATTTADNASKAAHTDLNNTIADSQADARALAKRIKVSTGYTTVLGDQLQIEGVEDSVDMTQQAPVLDTIAKSGGVVEVGFNKMSAEGIHLYSQRDGDAGYTRSPAKPIRPTWTTGHWRRRANRRRANTKPCSSSAKPKSVWKAMSRKPRPRHENKSKRRRLAIPGHQPGQRRLAGRIPIEYLPAGQPHPPAPPTPPPAIPPSK